MDAQVSLTGNLGTEVDFVSGDGWCGGRFRIAHTPRFWREGQWVDGTTTWMSVRVWGRLAQNCRDCLRKGDPVVVTGRLRTRTWVDEEEQEREQLVVEAFAVGHDLARGRSVFQRTSRHEAPIADGTRRGEAGAPEPGCPDSAGLDPWQAQVDEAARPDRHDHDEVGEVAGDDESGKVAGEVGAASR